MSKKTPSEQRKRRGRVRLSQDSAPHPRVLRSTSVLVRGAAADSSFCRFSSGLAAERAMSAPGQLTVTLDSGGIVRRLVALIDALFVSAGRFLRVSSYTLAAGDRA